MKLIDRMKSNDIIICAMKRVKKLRLKEFDRDRIIKHVNSNYIKPILNSRNKTIVCPICNSPSEYITLRDKTEKGRRDYKYYLHCEEHGDIGTMRLFEMIITPMLDIEDNPKEILLWFFKVEIVQKK